MMNWLRSRRNRCACARKFFRRTGVRGVTPSPLEWKRNDIRKREDEPLLVAQGFDGIEPRGFHRGIDSEKQADAHRHQHRGNYGPDRKSTRLNSSHLVISY